MEMVRTMTRVIEIGDVVRLTENRRGLSRIGILSMAGMLAIVTRTDYPPSNSGEPRLLVWIGRDNLGVPCLTTCFVMRWQVYPISPMLHERYVCSANYGGPHLFEPSRMGTRLLVTMCESCGAIGRRLGSEPWRYFL